MLVLVVFVRCYNNVTYSLLQCCAVSTTYDDYLPLLKSTTLSVSAAYIRKPSPVYEYLPKLFKVGRSCSNFDDFVQILVGIIQEEKIYIVYGKYVKVINFEKVNNFKGRMTFIWLTEKMT